MLTTDHGRGASGDEWRHHGSRIPDAEPLFSNQVAATLARLVGLDYGRHRPGAGPPVAPLFTE